jgi:hypothetical protein
MGKESEYFEESADLLNSADAVVSCTSHALYKEMAARYSDDKLNPVGAFNIHYLFDSVSRTVKRVYLCTPEEDLKRAPIYGQIRATNCEGVRASNAYARDAAFCDAYLSLVKGESHPEGDLYDVGYALEIATSVLKGRVLEWILDSGQGEYPFSREKFDLDEWLSGFNDPEKGRKHG